VSWATEWGTVAAWAALVLGLGNAAFMVWKHYDDKKHREFVERDKVSLSTMQKRRDAYLVISSQLGKIQFGRKPTMNFDPVYPPDNFEEIVEELTCHDSVRDILGESLLTFNGYYRDRANAILDRISYTDQLISEQLTDGGGTQWERNYETLRTQQLNSVTELARLVLDASAHLDHKVKP